MRNLLLQSWCGQLDLQVPIEKAWEEVVYGFRRQGFTIFLWFCYVASVNAPDEKKVEESVKNLLAKLASSPMKESASSAKISLQQNMSKLLAANGSGTNTNSAHISGLIQKLKAGEITQTQLYSQLSSLFKNSKTESQVTGESMY